MTNCIYSLFAEGVQIIAEVNTPSGFVRTLQKRNGETVRVLYKMYTKHDGTRYYTPERFV